MPDWRAIEKMQKSCLSCKSFVPCGDKRKGKPAYFCGKYLPLRKLSPKNLSPDKELDWGDLVPDSEKYEGATKTSVMIPSKYNVDDLDVVSMIETSYDEDTQTVRDMKIDDRDLPRAKNYYDFCMNMLGKETKIPFARQMYMGYQLHAEYCPRCSDPKWELITNIPVGYPTKEMPEHIQFLEHGVCKKCKITRSELVRLGELNLYTELDACVGQRGGKSVWTASDSAYITHSYLKLPKLSSICTGIQDFSPITATFVAVRFADAYALLWTPMVKMMDESPWFKDYHKLLIDSGERYGKEILKKRDVFIRYGHKNLELIPAGPNKRGLRGRTRFIGAIDELGWFPIRESKGKGIDIEDEPSDSGDRERADAEEVYIALENSMGTVNTEIRKLMVEKQLNTLMPAYMICVSSPSSRQDKIWRLVQSNKNSKDALAIHLPTWEMNPHMPQDSAFITKRYKKDPMKAERDLGANPPKSASQFIEDLSVKNCFVGKNRVAWTYVSTTKNGKEYIAAKLSRINPAIDIYPCVAAIDAGYSGNSFSLVVGHKEGLIVRTDAIVEIQPSEGKVLHYNGIYKGVIEPIIKAFNVKFLFADRWQSIAILHRAMDDLKIEAAMYSVKWNDFILTKSKLENTEIILPKITKEFTDEESVIGYPWNFKDYTAEHLLHQIHTVIEVGKTVTKGPGYTDDIFRALVLLMSRIYDPKISEKLDKMRVVRRLSKYMGAVSTNSNAVVKTIGRQKIAAFGRHL
jgi:hypothetical protein